MYCLRGTHRVLGALVRLLREAAGKCPMGFMAEPLSGICEPVSRVVCGFPDPCCGCCETLSLFSVPSPLRLFSALRSTVSDLGGTNQQWPCRQSSENEAMLPWEQGDMGCVNLFFLFSCSLKSCIQSQNFCSNRLLESFHCTLEFLQGYSCPRLVVQIDISVWV